MNQGNYETQQFYYDHPQCTFSLPVIVSSSSSPTVSYTYSQSTPSTSNYKPFRNAYPSFPTIPCYFSNTSPD